MTQRERDKRATGQFSDELVRLLLAAVHIQKSVHYYGSRTLLIDVTGNPENYSINFFYEQKWPLSPPPVAGEA